MNHHKVIAVSSCAVVWFLFYSANIMGSKWDVDICLLHNVKYILLIPL